MWSDVSRGAQPRTHRAQIRGAPTLLLCPLTTSAQLLCLQTPRTGGANKYQKSQVPGEGFVATAKIKKDESIKQAMSLFKKKCIMFSPPIRQFVWENVIYKLDGKEVSVLKMFMRCPL